MTQTLLIAGTASHVGKTTVAAGICRLLADRGVSVAPFKAQNMSNNARAVPRAPETVTAATDSASTAASDALYGEIGVAQYVQARAAGIQPTTDLNPVLLKPRGECESQLVVDGVAVGHYEAGQYYDDHWEQAKAAAVASYDRLAADHEIIVAEGAGSIAEINFHDQDLANVETARFGDAKIVLVGDIERGGVFASLVGTLELMPSDLREQVVGVVITKFRGDPALLAPGIESFEAKTAVDVLGVIPYDDPGLPAEDSVALPATDERAIRGEDDTPPARQVMVAVPRLPRISNFTDLDPLAATPGVRVAYVPLDSTLADADAVVIPGTKNTVDDLLALKQAGFDTELQQFDGPIVGLCGGYQMLGEAIEHADIEGTGDVQSTVSGIGLLPVTTTFSETKRVVATTLQLTDQGLFADAADTVSGYEIHMGTTQATDTVETPFARNGEATAAVGASADSVVGCYLHGLFENASLREAFVDRVFAAADTERPAGDTSLSSPYDRAAELVAEHCSLSWLERLLSVEFD